MRRLLPIVLVLLASGAGAQQWIVVPEEQRSTEPESPAQPEAAPAMAASAPGGVVRVLDKIDGTLTDLELSTGETGVAGTLTVTMGECRYPSDNPAGDAFALVSIRRAQDEVAVFEGWLIASAPALNALDHPRYDVWALSCLGA